MPSLLVWADCGYSNFVKEVHDMDFMTEPFLLKENMSVFAILFQPKFFAPKYVLPEDFEFSWTLFEGLTYCVKVS